MTAQTTAHSRRSAHIAGLGQWLPDAVRENDAWPPAFIEASRRRLGARELVELPAGETAASWDRITRRHVVADADDPFIGATRRRVADADTSAAQAEARAAQVALADAGVEPQAVDVVISWAGVPDRVTPSNAPRVARLVGAHRAHAFGMEASCATVVSQLTTAAALIESGRAQVVVLTQSHLMTRAFPLMHPACPGIGDAATAIVVTAGGGGCIGASYAETDGAFYDAVVWTRDGGGPWWRGGGPAQPGSDDRAGARHLMQNTVRFGAQTVGELARRADIPVSRIAALASVQPRRWIPGAIAESLGLPCEVAPQTYDDLAHLGACGVVTNLLAARERGLLAPGALAAIYAQGAGFTRGAAFLHW